MTLTKQETIDRILSFKNKELSDWIRGRLRGSDKYFPIYEGYETNLSEFLAEAFQHIDDDGFRDNFLKIMDNLTKELLDFTKDKKSIEKNKEYIHELLSLCGSIEEFTNKELLLKIAESGKFKGIKADDIELHQLLLNTLAAYHVAGDVDFWIRQMKDDSNKYYANAAFYAILNAGFKPEILFNHIGIFIERFKGEIDLVWGIRALINSYSYKEISKRFREIDTLLSREQKDAVNESLIKEGYQKIFKEKQTVNKIMTNLIGNPRDLRPVFFNSIGYRIAG